MFDFFLHNATITPGFQVLYLISFDFIEFSHKPISKNQARGHSKKPIRKKG